MKTELYTLATLQGLPIVFALTRAKADERETLLDLLSAEPELVAARPRHRDLPEHRHQRPFLAPLRPRPGRALQLGVLASSDDSQQAIPSKHSSDAANAPSVRLRDRAPNNRLIY